MDEPIICHRTLARVAGGEPCLGPRCALWRDHVDGEGGGYCVDAVTASGPGWHVTSRRMRRMSPEEGAQAQARYVTKGGTAWAEVSCETCPLGPRVEP